MMRSDSAIMVGLFVVDRGGDDATPLLRCEVETTVAVESSRVLSCYRRSPTLCNARVGFAMNSVYA